MDDLAAELEAALVGGTLLVWAEKYRYADATVLPALRAKSSFARRRRTSAGAPDGLDERTARGLLAAVGGPTRISSD